MLHSTFFATKENSLIPKNKLQIYCYNKNIYTEIVALVKRLYIQSYRRPSNIIAGIIQPLLWLILFGALFQNAPINLLGQYNIKYTQFLSYGIISFTAFSSSINAGLPIIFDREFGFFNRLLVSPIINKSALILSLVIYTLILSIIQIVIITILSLYLEKNMLEIYHIVSIISITTIMIINISNFSICISFILPGHIEFLAFTLIINLPVLFSSTALAPLSFMPYWLQMIACFNPLTYSIEIIRYICINNSLKWNINIIETLWLQINIQNCILILIITNILSLMIVKKIVKYKYN
uniref:Putative chloroplast RF38 n=1 Tax=Cumathamnion serrulatum TaxID=1206573 RepID=A0A7U1AQY1_9FLOR|nr:putative chloroplast RF38 [Cumathamnion serrulatum]QQY85290.1 putative chloroplast RF38 [Cumathamnion serrulatum]